MWLNEEKLIAYYEILFDEMLIKLIIYWFEWNILWGEYVHEVFRKWI